MFMQGYKVEMIKHNCRLFSLNVIFFVELKLEKAAFDLNGLVIVTIYIYSLLLLSIKMQ